MTATGESAWRLDWPTSSGRRVGAGLLKATPADFRVDEILDVSRCQGGEHLYLQIEKTGDNTEFVARQLSGIAGCRPFDVGFCGLKDRHAVTRQWFSLYRPGLEHEDAGLIERVGQTWPVLSSCRGQKKLRRADHSGNWFDIVLSQVQGSRDRIDTALNLLREQGAPNYFGPQRFGHQGGNLDRAVTMNPASMISRRRGKMRGRNRSASGSADAKNVLYFSAARSWLFNEVLAERVDAGNWRNLLEGEPGLDGVEDMLPTGPLWGDGGTGATGIQGEYERQVVSRYPRVEAVFSLTRMKPERRPLVLMPQGLQWVWLGGDRLRLSFGLMPGQYATTLLSDVFDSVTSGGNCANSVVQ